MGRKYFTKCYIELVRDESVKYDATIHNRSDAYNRFLEVFKLDKRSEENLVMFSLNNMNSIIGAFLISKGNINSTNFSVTNIIKSAILCNGNKIILAHNHPSGNAHPSKEDIDATTRIKNACEIMGIELLDHIIIGNDNYEAISIR